MSGKRSYVRDDTLLVVDVDRPFTVCRVVAVNYVLDMRISSM